LFLRLEVFGHYLELGKTVEAEEVELAPEGTQYPLQICVEPLGFRILSDDGEIATDV
jgi:hypothetical protein